MPASSPIATTSGHVGERSQTAWPTVAWRYMAVLLALTAFTWGSQLYAVKILHWHPQGTRLWSPWDDRFGDFWHYRVLFGLLHTQAFFNGADRFAYPAPCAVLYEALFHLPYPHAVYCALLWTSDAASALALAWILMRGGLSTAAALAFAGLTFLFSYPWYRLYDRGNLELFVYLAVAGGVLALAAKRPALAAALWGVAGAMKLYPVILLAFFLRRASLKTFLAGAASMAAVLVASFAWVGPTIGAAARGTVSGIAGFSGNYAVHARIEELFEDHSILGTLKEILSQHMFHGDFHASWDRLSHNYQIVAAILAPLLFFTLGRRLPAANRLAILLAYIVILPPVSYDYTLIHTYIILALVLWAALQARASSRNFRHATSYALCFGVLSTAQTFWRFRGLWLNGPLKCAAVLVILYLLYTEPLTGNQPATQPGGLDEAMGARLFRYPQLP